MKRINKRIQAEGIDTIVSFYDQPTPKGFPTKDSLAIMVVGKFDPETGLLNYGVAVKAPSDEFKGRVGKAIGLGDYFDAPKQAAMVGEDNASVIFSILSDLFRRTKSGEIRTSHRKRLSDVLSRYIAEIVCSA